MQSSTPSSKPIAEAGLPAIDVSPLQGKFLQVLVQITQAKRVLEIGTLGGYSTIWMARALPKGGRIVTLELNPRHAEVARANLRTAGLLNRVDIRVGPALDSLPELNAEKRRPVRPDLHRRRQGKQSAVSRVGAEALAAAAR